MKLMNYEETPQGDLISREALQDKFDNYCPHIECKKCRWYSMEDSFHKCALIDNAPTVNIPKGEWIDHSTYKNVIICSNCNIGGNHFYKDFNFCPNCGADMRGGKE